MALHIHKHTLIIQIFCFRFMVVSSSFLFQQPPVVAVVVVVTGSIARQSLV
jgi:hypothetical protein